MRHVLLLAALLCGGAALRAEIPPLLAAARQRLLEDHGRWAYTETRQQLDRHGGLKEELVIRHDPSQPFDQREELLSRNGQPATAEEREKFHKHRLKQQRDRENPRKKQRHETRLEDIVAMDRAHVRAEDDAAVTYEVPLLLDGNRRFPPEKFEVLVRVGKERAEIQHVAVRLRAAIRAALVAKIRRAELDVDFIAQSPEHAAPAVRIRGHGQGTFLLVPVGAGVDVRRTDSRRVTPYDERFQVELGEAKVFDF